MINTNVTNFRKQIFELIDQTVKYNEPINISTKSGNAVLISEEDYNNLVETMYLNSIPGMSEKLKDGIELRLRSVKNLSGNYKLMITKSAQRIRRKSSSILH